MVFAPTSGISRIPAQYCFGGNVKLRRSGVQVALDQHQLAELRRCRKDPWYFIENYVKIRHVDRGLVPMILYPFQREIIDALLNNRFVVAKLARQCGKSTTCAAFFLWKILFQDQYQVAFLANRAATAREILSRVRTAYEELPFWMQIGALEWNKGKIVLENGSMIVADATSGNGGRGFSFNAILLDEFAHLAGFGKGKDLQNEFFTSMFPVISSGETTQVAIISTPKGMEMFYDIFSGAPLNGYKALEFNWKDVPGRTEAWAEAERKRIGDLRFAQEYDCEFLGSSATLIPGTTLRELKAKDPIRRVNEEGISIWEEPQENHQYVIVLDTAEGKGEGADFHAAHVIDVTRTDANAVAKQVAKFHTNNIGYLTVPSILANLGRYYNDAYVLSEIASTGQQIMDSLWFDYEYENILRTHLNGKQGQVLGRHPQGQKQTQRGVKMTPAVKKTGCQILRHIMIHRKLEINDSETIREMTTFVGSPNGTYAASGSNKDDLVMALVIYAWLTNQPRFKMEVVNLTKVLDDDRAGRDEHLAESFFTSVKEAKGGWGLPEGAIVSDGLVWNRIF